MYCRGGWTGRRIVEGAATRRLGDDLRDAPWDCQRFFTALFTAPADFTTVRALVVCPRGDSHDPRQPICAQGAAVAEGLSGDSPPRRVPPRCWRIQRRRSRSVATHLEYSSPQSFGRHLQLRLQLTPSALPQGLRRRAHARTLPHVRSYLASSPALRTFSPRGFRPRLYPGLGEGIAATARLAAAGASPIPSWRRYPAAAPARARGARLASIASRPPSSRSTRASTPATYRQPPRELPRSPAVPTRRS